VKQFSTSLFTPSRRWWARRPRESRVDVHSLGLDYSRWYCRWHFYSKTPAIPVSRLPFVDIPYWDRLFFHRWNLWFCFISFEQSHRELSWVFVRFPGSYFTAGYHPWYAIKYQMRTLSNEPLYEYTRRQLAAKPELRPKVQTRMRNVLLLFYRQLNKETAQTQGQDVRQLSDSVLVSRSPKSSLFFPSLTMVRRDSALSLGLKQLCETEWWSPLFWRPVPAPPLSRYIRWY